MLLGAVLLSGCSTAASVSATPSANTPVLSPSVVASSEPPSSGTTGGVSAPTSIPADHWAAILADLSARGVATDGLEVVSAKAVTWPNGAWGCPKQGSVYTQALVNGYQVVVKAGSRTYDYRFGSTATPRLCEL